jgi:CheY-like chemotaxis protein
MIGATGVIRDFTERHLAQEALQKARAAAEAANQAKNDFLSRMSHELRTPLNAVIGFGQLMELEAETPDQRESASQILKGGRHLLSLINEVLDITGIESGRVALSAEPVLVSEVVAEVRELIQPLAAKRRIALRSEMATMSGQFVQADRQRFKQILLNLAANAVKYNREGGSATIACAWPVEGRLRIVVTDTGPGIPRLKLPRLFTAFDRLDVDSSVEGTGLGLALSKSLAEAMGGSLGVETNLGVGSSFWVELPRAESPLTRLATSEGDFVTRPIADEPRKGAKVLYIEDNLSNVTLIQRILARHQHIHLIPAMSGALAIDLARLHRPDLVLLDLHLPDMPGEEVLRRLRQEPACRDVPVVVLSADATPAQSERLLAAGARAYLTKPLDLKAFMAVLDEVLDHTAEAGVTELAS